MKKIILSIISILTLLCVFAGCGNSKGNNNDNVIKIPGGPTLSVVFDGPDQLKVEWETLEFKDYMPHGVGVIKNISNNEVKYSTIQYWLDNSPQGFDEGTTLSSGETQRFGFQVVGLSENSKEITVEIQDFEILGSQPGSTEVEYSSSPKLEKSAFTKETFTEAPRKLRTPGDYVARFCFLVFQLKFDEAMEMSTGDILIAIEKIKSDPQVKEEFLDNFDSRDLEKVTITKIYEHEYEGKYDYDVNYDFEFEGGNIITDLSSSVIYVDGAWKIDE